VVFGLFLGYSSWNRIVLPGMTLSPGAGGSVLAAPSLILPFDAAPSPSLAVVSTMFIGNGSGLGVRLVLGALEVLAELVPELIIDLPMRTTRFGSESPPPRDQPGRRRTRASASVVLSPAPSIWKAGPESSGEVEPVRAKDKAVLRVRGMKNPSLPRGIDRP
jgi:hypothetical protein